MRKYILIFSFLGMLLLPQLSIAQKIIIPERDTTFVVEYRDDVEFVKIAKNGFVVGVSNELVSDDYGTFYRITILVQNMTKASYTFDPEDVTALLTDRDGIKEELNIYTAKEFQDKITNTQALVQVILGLSSGFSAGMAGTKTAYVNMPGYGGVRTLQPVTVYDPSAAKLARMESTTQMLMLSRQMEMDRKIYDGGYLKKNTIAAGEGIIGYMNIKRRKGLSMLITVRVNGNDYKFNWDIDTRKKKK